MNKSELIDVISSAADISKMAATRALDALLDGVSTALRKGQTVTLVGFGSFVVRERAARTGRNPKTGELMQIGACKIPSFKAGKALKDAVQQGDSKK